MGNKHGKRILIITIADVLAIVLQIRAPVHNALRIVDIAILTTTTKSLGVLGIRQVKEDQTGLQGASPRLEPNSNTVLLLLVRHNIVRPAQGQPLVPPAVQVLLVGENLGILGVNMLQLGQVKDLHAVVDGFGADKDVALVALDFSPERGRGRGVLRETAEIDELALLGDLGKGGAVFLSDGDELTALGRSPAPGTGALAGTGTELGVRLEVVQVEVVAAEGVLGVAGDVGGVPLLAGDVVELGRGELLVLLGVEDAGGLLFCPGFLWCGEV